ncbi:hypothetical protein [Pedobacter jejuensis]|uniref:Uncharacterized protein n=1 Tax=Pedobacter jejuensis TaxID=1268550 RepID=A0A3N0BQF7_9SPHI|nr:hypothetical protein [Pedobacter jejuensis]RNL51294.1 hypothetical protein D7004_16410 [Pedobacter jejuensis]
METNSNEKQSLNFDTHIEWDNDTYGHILNPELLKKKNEPNEEHLDFIEKDESGADLETSEKLKNINLSNDDVSSRNDNQEKGLGGKKL